jgi:GR25 family glycosyltransferase involved in LPS biosynthesis
MKTLNDFFDHIYCINLDRRTDRYEECLKEFQKINITVERVSAIDGKPIFKEGLNLNAGNYGLFLTQKKILQDAIDHNYKNFLMLEDDVTFNNNINERFFEKIKALPEDWDFLYLGGNNVFYKGTFRLITGDLNFKVAKENYKSLDYELCKTTWTQCAHAIAINSKFYDTLMTTMINNSTMAGDMIHPMLQQQGCNAYTFLPSLALQRAGFSDIDNVFWDHNIYDANSF